MSKRFGIVVAILCVAALALSAAAIWLACGSAEQQDVQYVLYLGTNDKDSNELVFAPEEALRQAEAILRDCFDGYTIQEATGRWIDGETEYQEYTQVIYLSDTSLEDVHRAADRILEVFHQSAVLIQANQTVTEFYGG